MRRPKDKRIKAWHHGSGRREVRYPGARCGDPARFADDAETISLVQATRASIAQPKRPRRSAISPADIPRVSPKGQQGHSLRCNKVPIEFVRDGFVLKATTRPPQTAIDTQPPIIRRMVRKSF
jgi:hypothetical protein